MRAKRPQFLATRSSRRHRACSMRTREDHSAIRGTLSRMTAVGQLGGRFRQPNLTRERRYRVLVSAQDRERRMCATSIGRLLLYANSGRQECANSGHSSGSGEQVRATFRRHLPSARSRQCSDFAPATLRRQRQRLELLPSRAKAAELIDRSARWRGSRRRSTPKLAGCSKNASTSHRSSCSHTYGRTASRLTSFRQAARTSCARSSRTLMACRGNK